MRCFLLSIFTFLLLASTSPTFSDFKSGTFFDVSKDIIKRESKHSYSTLVRNNLDKNGLGFIVYKHTFSYYPGQYFLIEYHFIKNHFCKGIEKYFFTDNMMSRDFAIKKYEEIKDKFIKEDQQNLTFDKDSIYENFSYEYNNNHSQYNNKTTLQITKEDSLYILTKKTVPVF